MNISVFGIGYVHYLTKGCLVKLGHKIAGVDVIDSKLNKLNNDLRSVNEPGLNNTLIKYKIFF